MSIAEELGATLDARMVGDLAGSGPFERGVGYWEDRRVQTVDEENGRLCATVRGTMPYRVGLWFEDGELAWDCTCPAAEDGSFCKHCTAVALSLLYADEPGDWVGARPSAEPADRDAERDADLLGQYVRRLEPGRLAEIVLSQTDADWRLREQLLLEARSEHGMGPNLARWRERIDGAFSFGEMDRWGHAQYRDVADWFDSVNTVIDALADLSAAGHRGAAAELLEHAYVRADLAMGEIYDEDGSVAYASERLAELHLEACESGSLDPVELAKRLANLELRCELEAFTRSAVRYAEVLGSAGLAAFREAVEPSWRQIDQSEGRRHDQDYGAYGRQYRARQAMIGWALATGDPDALVEAHRRERILPGETLLIAQAYESAGRHGEAVEWARTGLSGLGHGSWHASELRDFLARKLREQGNAGAAVDLYWNAFTASPSLHACRTLSQQDDRPDSPDWLERCLRHLRSRLGAGSFTVPPSLPADVMTTAADAAPEAACVLAEILLYEGLTEEAWEVALQHGVSRTLWMTLARIREETAPRDSIAIYEPQALAVIKRKVAKDYHIAVELMARIRRLACDAGEPALFDSLLHHVRTVHKAKRRLQSELAGLEPLADTCPDTSRDARELA